MTAQLILQAPDLRSADVEKLAAIAQANGVQNINRTAVRLIDADLESKGDIAHCCDMLGIDFAFLDRIKPLAECKILASDMDSTMINIECIDEIADMAGRKAEVAAITEAAMRGEIKDFAESLVRRVALLRGVPATALERVYQERLQLNPGAETLVAAAKQAGLKTLLVSGGFTFFTDRLKDRLGLDDARANRLEIIDGVLTGQVLGDILDGHGKAVAVQQLAVHHQAQPEHIIALGDGANDLEMLALAGYSVAYRAKPVVSAQANYALNVVSLDSILNWFTA
jgi:phosphoserine phosphatase